VNTINCHFLFRPVKVFLGRGLLGYERLFWGCLDKHSVCAGQRERESKLDHLSGLDFNAAIQ
jgi:hypothetical protein